MKRPGQVILFRFPQTDQLPGKLRPALLLAALPGPYDDWLICMISSRVSQCIEGFDEVVPQDAPDFASSGLKKASVVRVGRLAVVGGQTLVGSIGEIAGDRLTRIRANLTRWITTGA